MIKNIKKEYKIAFISTIIIGLICHTFYFTNVYPLGDTIGSLTGDYSQITSGRWFCYLLISIKNSYNKHGK